MSAPEKNTTAERADAAGSQTRRGPPPFSGSGLLDGCTILRFAHAFETGGGTERYLDDLDRALLERNAMTIVRLHLTRNPSPGGSTEEPIGQGRLVRLPLPILPGNDSPSTSDKHSLRFRLKQQARDWVLYNPLVWRSVGAKWTASLRLPRQPGQAVGAGLAASDALRTRNIDLVVLHFFGGADADEIVAEARRANVPYVVLNHYSNDRFLHLSMRKHAMRAAGVAGVNGLDLPRYVRDRFCNLSDGIDTEFFQRRNAARPIGAPTEPLILLPARVVRAKGHLDLIQAAAMMRQQGLEFAIGFAGRVESSTFVEELHRKIDRLGLKEDVHFLGELAVSTLRDWYGASAAVAFPTYHHEGLPRIILEAQAMEVPVVVYEAGGVAEGILSGQTGYVLKKGDIAGLSQRLLELVTDPRRRKQMGEAGRRWVEQRFSLKALAQRHEEFYHHVILSKKAIG